MSSLLQESCVLSSFCHYDLSPSKNRSGVQDQALSKTTPRWHLCCLSNLSGCISMTTNIFLQSQSVTNASSNMCNLQLKNIYFTKKHGTENKWVKHPRFIYFCSILPCSFVFSLWAFINVPQTSKAPWLFKKGSYPAGIRALLPPLLHNLPLWAEILWAVLLFSPDHNGGTLRCCTVLGQISENSELNHKHTVLAKYLPCCLLYTSLVCLSFLCLSEITEYHAENLRLYGIYCKNSAWNSFIFWSISQG